MKDKIASQLPSGFLVRSAALHHVYKHAVDADGIITGRGSLVVSRVTVVGFKAGDVRLPLGYLFEVTPDGLVNRIEHRLARPTDGTKMDKVWAEDQGYELVGRTHPGHDVVPHEEFVF